MYIPKNVQNFQRASASSTQGIYEKFPMLLENRPVFRIESSGPECSLEPFQFRPHPQRKTYEQWQKKLIKHQNACEEASKVMR